MIPLLTLGATNPITDPFTIANNLFTYFLFSEESQSKMFGKVASLRKIMGSGKDIHELQSSISLELGDVFKTWFTDVTVTVGITKTTDVTNALNINVNYTLDGIEYNLKKAVELINNRATVYDDYTEQIWRREIWVTK